MSGLPEQIEKNYPYNAAGRVWCVPELRLARLPDGTLGLSLAEIERVHRAIANVVCGSASTLTVEELDFLCDITSSTRSEVAASLGLHRTTLSKWKAAKEHLTPLVSRALKWWFWFRIFGAYVARQKIPFRELPDPTHFLRVAHQRAVDLHLVDAIEPLRLAS